MSQITHDRQKDKKTKHEKRVEISGIAVLHEVILPNDNT